MNTFVGAFPGAMPLLSGWFMVQESFSYFILLLFLMLYLWQLPHFFSIAWIYRRSYESANLKMVSIHDESGRRTRFYLVFSSVLFVVATYLPLFYGDLGGIYIYVVTLLNICLIGYVCKFCFDLNDMIARKILFITIFYPPSIFLALLCLFLFGFLVMVLIRSIANTFMPDETLSSWGEIPWRVYVAVMEGSAAETDGDSNWVAKITSILGQRFGFKEHEG